MKSNYRFCRWCGEVLLDNRRYVYYCSKECRKQKKKRDYQTNLSYSAKKKIADDYYVKNIDLLPDYVIRNRLGLIKRFSKKKRFKKKSCKTKEGD